MGDQSHYNVILHAQVCYFADLAHSPLLPQGRPSKYVDAVEAEGHTVDTCGGHATPTHQYHVHSGIGMMTNKLRESCTLPTDVPAQHSSLLGWMFDGYGMYGRYSLNGRGMGPTFIIPH